MEFGTFSLQALLKALAVAFQPVWLLNVLANS
jgi:hypothetical protein